MTKNISYTEFEQKLQGLGVQISAAEVHGILSGMLSVAEPKDPDAWRSALEEILDCGKPDREHWSMFTKLKTKILADLNHKAFAFKLMLPDDEVSLQLRLEALADWCRGYLSGLGLVGMTAMALNNPVVKELLEDLSQIAQLSPKTDESEDDEKNYVELLEYVRIAVQNIYLELQSINKQKILH